MLQLRQIWGPVTADHITSSGASTIAFQAQQQTSRNLASMACKCSRTVNQETSMRRTISTVGFSPYPMAMAMLGHRIGALTPVAALLGTKMHLAKQALYPDTQHPIVHGGRQLTWPACVQAFSALPSPPPWGGRRMLCPIAAQHMRLCRCPAK